MPLDQDDDDEVVIKVAHSQQPDKVPTYIDSSPLKQCFLDSSDVESNASSIDSIRRGADFIRF
jgi:hypothetical protein